MNQLSRIPDYEGKIISQNHRQFTIPHDSYNLHALYWPKLSTAAINKFAYNAVKTFVDKDTSKVAPDLKIPHRMETHNTKLLEWM